MPVVKYIKNSLLFAVCFLFALWLSSYGKPLNGITLWVMDHTWCLFNSRLSEPYESGADPISFITILVMALLYALLLFFFIRMVLKKCK